MGRLETVCCRKPPPKLLSTVAAICLVEKLLNRQDKKKKKKNPIPRYTLHVRNIKYETYDLCMRSTQCTNERKPTIQCSFQKPINITPSTIRKYQYDDDDEYNKTQTSIPRLRRSLSISIWTPLQGADYEKIIIFFFI